MREKPWRSGINPQERGDTFHDDGSNGVGMGVGNQIPRKGEDVSCDKGTIDVVVNQKPRRRGTHPMMRKGGMRARGYDGYVSGIFSHGRCIVTGHLHGPVGILLSHFQD